MLVKLGLRTCDEGILCSFASLWDIFLMGARPGQKVSYDFCCFVDLCGCHI